MRKAIGLIINENKEIVNFYRNYKNSLQCEMTNFEYEFPETKIKRLP